MKNEDMLYELMIQQEYINAMKQHSVLLTDKNFIPFSKEMNWAFFKAPEGKTKHFVIIWKDCFQMTIKEILAAEEEIIEKAKKNKEKIPCVTEAEKDSLLKAATLIKEALSEVCYSTSVEAFELLIQKYPDLYPTEEYIKNWLKTCGQD